MRRITHLRVRLRSLLRARRLEAEIDDELRFHLDREVERRVAAGLTPEEARTTALREFGGVQQQKERVREARGLTLLDEARQDASYAVRMLARYPAFTLVAVLSLALGIGANTVVFGLTNGLLLRPLAVASPDEIVFVDRNGEPAISYPNYLDIRDRNTVFSSLAMYRLAPLSLGTGRGAQRVWGYLATGSYFEMLGVEPALGRFFGPSEDGAPGASPWAVISHECWITRFGGDPAIVGRTIRVNTHPYTVLGVAPAGFQGTERFYWPEVWLPLSMQAQIEGFPWLEARGNSNGWVVGRLRPGVTRAQAGANLAALATQLAGEHRVNEGMALTASAPGLAGALLGRPVAAFMTGLMLLASLVLLSACANIASLLSARLVDRRRELSIRLAIGAGRGRIVRQLVTESLVLSCAGGLAALPIAAGLLALVSRWQAPLDFPIRLDVRADPVVFGFAFAAALACGVIFGVAPAVRASASDPAPALKGDDAPSPVRRWAARDLLLVAQVAVCCLLVTATLVGVRGLVRSLDAPLGFRPDGAAVVGYDIGLAGRPHDEGPRFHLRARDAVADLPGITAVAFASALPLGIDQSTTAVYPEWVTDFRPQHSVSATYYRVSPGFFRTIGTTLLAGRDFTEHDDADAPLVAIVNETFARRVLGRADCVGCTFRYWQDQPVEVIGIVEDGKYATLTESAQPVLFQPMLRHGQSNAVLVARSTRPEREIAEEMRRTLAALDPDLPLYGIGSLRQMLGLVYLPVRAAAIALGAFGLLAVMLAVTGIYGLAAYAVSARVREIGIRVAIGARPVQIVRHVFLRLVVLLAVGSALGLALGAAGAGVLASIALGVSSRDPVLLAGAALAMLLIALAAALGPMRRALRVDPVQALRQQ